MSSKTGGDEFEHEELEDALFELASELLPDSPAAEWDEEWAHGLSEGAHARFKEHFRGLSQEGIELNFSALSG